MVGPSTPISSAAVVPAASNAARPAKPATPKAPVQPQGFADTPAHRIAARAPADLSVVPADSGLRLIYIFRDPESGETIRQYPTQPLVELGRAGARLDRQV